MHGFTSFSLHISFLYFVLFFLSSSLKTVFPYFIRVLLYYTHFFLPFFSESPFLFYLVSFSSSRNFSILFVHFNLITVPCLFYFTYLLHLIFLVFFSPYILTRHHFHSPQHHPHNCIRFHFNNNIFTLYLPFPIYF